MYTVSLRVFVYQRCHQPHIYSSGSELVDGTPRKSLMYFSSSYCLLITLLLIDIVIHLLDFMPLDALPVCQFVNNSLKTNLLAILVGLMLDLTLNVQIDMACACISLC